MTLTNDGDDSSHKYTTSYERDIAFLPLKTLPGS